MGGFFLLDNVAINRCCQEQRMGELPGRRVISGEEESFLISNMGTGSFRMAAEMRLMSGVLLNCSDC